MKILLFLNSDIHCATAFKLLFSSLEKHQVKIILSKKIGNLTNLPPELFEMKRCEQFENENFFKFQTSSYLNVNSEAAIQDFQNFAPDLIISIRFGQIFKTPLIQTARFGVLNLHSGILPNYRGVMASFWAILHGEKNLGTTLHYITDASIDTGDVVAFSNTAIDWNCSLLTNINNIYEAGCGLILQALIKISAGEKINVIKQKDLGAGQYFSYPKEADIKKFSQLMPLVKNGEAQRILECF
jgi:methionyl-tRNA formyltransferase